MQTAKHILRSASPAHRSTSRYVNKFYSAVTNSWYITDGLDPISSLYVGVEYYRSFEYCLKWKSSMYPKRSSRLQKASNKSPQSSPTSNDVIQHRLRSWRRRTSLKKDEPGDNTIADEKKVRDIFDIISNSHDVECFAGEDEEKITEITDKGLDDSDEESHSVCDSTASGPSHAYQQTLKKPTQNLCSSCRKLYQRAKRIKTPIKSKLLDNDPVSLTCDQWVLIKKWAPSRAPNVQRRLLSHIKHIKKISVKQVEQYVSEEELSTCSRPHTFLQRNLRCCVKKQTKKDKKSGRKRRRDDSQGSRVRKQQRRHGNNHTQPINITCVDDGPDNLNEDSPSVEGYASQKSEDSADTNVVELIPTTVTHTTAQPAEVPPKQKTSRKTRGFRDLLSQLRGNTSVIIRETR